MEIKGVDEILAKMAKLETKPIRNAMRRALRKGATPIVRAARQKAKSFDDPNTPASIAQNITTSNGGISRERDAGGPLVRIGVRGGAKTGATQEFTNTKKNQELGIVGQSYSVAHWRFLEFGTSEMRAQPFLRPAAIEQADAAANAIIAAMGPELDEEFNKL